MKEIFVEREIQYNLRVTNNIYARKPRTTAYGLENVSFLGQNLCRDLPLHIKESLTVKHFLCIEIFKTVKQLNPPFMQNIFRLWSSHYSLRNPNSLAHVRPNQTTFGSNSLSCIGPQIWNGLPNEIKSVENLKSFKTLIKQWNGPICKCSACKSLPP